MRGSSLAVATGTLAPGDDLRGAQRVSGDTQRRLARHGGTKGGHVISLRSSAHWGAVQIGVVSGPEERDEQRGGGSFFRWIVLSRKSALIMSRGGPVETRDLRDSYEAVIDESDLF